MTRPPPPALQLVISVAEQKLAVVKDGGLVRKYPISTSKFGLGDTFNSYRTPLGRLRICDKIGDDLPSGAVLKRRNATGEILPVNSPGRDPIVTRILWLDGLDSGNANAKSRGIYIHGTVEESKLGQPVSYGCIRMSSRDVVELFDDAPVGTPVEIIEERLPRFRKFTPKTETLFASRDNITTTFGPRGMVIVRTGRLSAAATAKPAPPPAEDIKMASAKPAPASKPAELTPKLPETPAKLLAKTSPPPPATVAEGPIVLIPTARPSARHAIAALPTRTEPPAAEEPRVLLMSGSMLTADLVAKPKSAPLPPPSNPATPQPVPEVEAAREEIPTGPRLLALDLSAVSYALFGDDADRAPILDALSLHLFHPPTPSPAMRLAFRARLPQPDL